MTGDPARLFMQNDAKTAWTRSDLVNKKDDKSRRKCAFVDADEEIDNATMFEVILKYHKLRSVLSAGGSSGVDGLHKGHAYSILEVKKYSPNFMTGPTFRMVKIRNPWGSGEWK